MSQPQNPLDDLRRDLERLRREVDGLQSKATFADEVRDVSEKAARLRPLGAEIQRLRGRGWVWDPTWEATFADLEREAAQVVRDLRADSAEASQRLERQLDALSSTLQRIQPALHQRDEVDQAERETKAVAREVQATAQRLEAVAKPFAEPFDRLERALKDADTHLDRFEAATFPLQPGEHPWLTVDASWEDGPGGKLTGFLYFTDRRIRFEQKETLTTKKWLFFTASSEDKHALLLDEPVGNLVGSEDGTRGLVFKDQLLTLQWGPGSRQRTTTFDVNTGSAKEWDERIEGLRAGSLTHLQVAAAAANPNAGMPIDAPTQCTACGGALDAPVRGQTTLVCKYCGQRHDLRLA